MKLKSRRFQTAWFLGLVLSSLASGASFAQVFDTGKYDPGIGFNTPMSTIAGLTDWAQDINYVYGITAWVTLFIFLAVAIPVVVAVYKFRVKPGDDRDIVPKQVHGNAVLEFTWTIVPCILLVIIAVPTWKVIFGQSENLQPDALEVEVIGHQWWWEFRYPKYNITTANELHLPENTQIKYTISSADVIHSFWVPVLGGKVDALPGKDAKNIMIYTTPSVPEENLVGGKYYQGQCAELCGASHALMRFNAVLHTKEEFERWAAVYNEPPLVETPDQKRGEQVFAQCVACHTIAGTASAQIPGDKIGPDLTDFGNRAYLAAGTRRNTQENLAEWIENPPALKPGALMPPLGLSPEDIAAVSAYLRQSTAKSF